MRIAVAADHAGFRYKQLIKQRLEQLGHVVSDFGTHSEDPVDYPDVVFQVARAVSEGDCDRGVVAGGSGNGEAMAANRVHGVRCALAWSRESARLSRAHNDANMLSIGQRLIEPELALEILEVWLTTPFDGGRHLTRIRKLDEPNPV
jgi:ribose 5-phosphate isomerase B